MPPRNVFLSYATNGFIEARDALCKSALKVGFDEARTRSTDDIEPLFAEKHNAILSQPRGAGYWLWKPQIILQELRTLKEDDLLVYCDAGRSPYYQLKNFPKQLAKQARENGFLLGPTLGQHGPLSKWTKRDTLVLLEMDSPDIHKKPQIQAGWNFWTPTKNSFAFLEAWITACSDPRILTDAHNTLGLSNLPEFKDHRHDQAVLSLLCYKYSAPHINYSGTLVERFLLLRPQSLLSHMFLRRIDDAEMIAKKTIIKSVTAIIRSYTDSKFKS